MGRKKNLKSFIRKLLKFGTGSVLSGLQVLYISAFFLLLVFMAFVFISSTISMYNDSKLISFYAFLLGSFSISILTVSNFLGKELNAFNRKLFFTMISYIYLFFIMSPLSMNKLFEAMSSKIKIKSL